MSLSSAAARSTEPLRAPRRAPSRPPLRLVEEGRRRVARVPFLVVCATLLMAGLVAVLVLNITLSQGSYTLADLQSKAADLDGRQVALRQDIDAVSSTGHLAEQATKLDMAPVAAPMFLDPTTGRISGDAAAAHQVPSFTVVGGRAAAVPEERPTGTAAAAVTASGGLGLGGGLLGAVASLGPR